MAVLAAIVVATVGCSRVEKWVSLNADERFAHEVERAADRLTEGNRHPSGVPIRRIKPTGAGATASGAPSADAVPSSSP